MSGYFRFVDLDAFEQIRELGELAEALEELGRALEEVERAGYAISFHWPSHAEHAGEEPGNKGVGLLMWADRVRAHQYR